MEVHTLEKRRAALGVTYVELAKRSGRNLHTVRRMLKGHGGPTLQTYTAVCRALEEAEQARAASAQPGDGGQP